DGLAELQERHAAAMEQLFKDWETRWRDCRECLEAVRPVAQFLWTIKEVRHPVWVTYWGYSTAERIGEMDAANRILQQEESFWSGRTDREARDALQPSYGKQALLLPEWAPLEEAMELLNRAEPIPSELGDKDYLQ